MNGTDKQHNVQVCANAVWVTHGFKLLQHCREQIHQLLLANTKQLQQDNKQTS
jgi:hypothetical protein